MRTGTTSGGGMAWDVVACRVGGFHRGDRMRRGSVLVAVLWCLALLGVLVIGVLHGARMDLQVARLHADRVQARYLALAGVEKAKALLHREARDRSRSAQNHSGQLFDAPQHFRNVPFGRGSFRVFRRGRLEEGGGVVFGVDDEESRLNVNTATANDLTRLEGLTSEVAASIVDWRDPDRVVTPGGAELEYYAGMRPPSMPRDGPIESLREILAIRGVSARWFQGSDTRLNGGVGEEMDEDAGDLDRGGEEGGNWETAGALDEPGWAASLTVHSGVGNVSAAGQDRVNVQTADEATLATVSGITTEIAKGIVAHRQRNRLESLADLLEVGPAPAPNANPGSNPPTEVGRSPGFPVAGAPPGGPNAGGSNPGGPKLISQDLLIRIADAVTVESASMQPGLMNVNTAGLQALMCLPGVSRELAQAVIGYRGSAGYLPNVAALLRVPGMTTEIFKQIAGRVTVRSETFRILAEGRVNSSGVRQRILSTVRVELDGVETLSHREDDL